MSKTQVKNTKKKSKTQVKNTNDFYTKEEYQKAIKYYERKIKEHKTSSNDQK